MRDEMADRIEGLRSKRRALRRRIAVEAFIGVALLAIAVFVVVRVATTRQGVEPPGAQVNRNTPATQPPLAGGEVERESSSPQRRRSGGPPAVEPRERPTQPAVNHRAARVGDVVVSLERAAVTRQVLTRFFGIPAHGEDPALEVHIRVTNPGSVPVAYSTLRGSGAGTAADVQVVDDRGRIYPAIDFGAVPAGGVDVATIEPGLSLGDVLFFRAPPPDVRYIDLVIHGWSLGASQNVTIRLLANAVEYESPQTETSDTLDRTPTRTFDEEPVSPTRPAPPPAPAPDRIGPAEAARHTRLLAEAGGGDTAAQIEVGRNYETGHGTNRDSIRARAYYTMAAERGDTEGQWNLGRAMRDGVGAAPDAEGALRWFLKAAVREHRQAQWDAAHLLMSGDGVRQNLHQAKRWLAELVKAGHREAQFELLELDPTAYAAAATLLKMRNTGPVHKPGTAVKVEGRLRDRDGNRWSLVMDNGRTVPVDLSRIEEPHLGEGIHVQTCGILDADGSLEVLLGVVPEPRCTVTSARVLNPQGVVPYRQTRYLTEIRVRNVGVQPVQKVSVSARVRVMSTPSQPLAGTVQNLAPGETGIIRLEFTLYNPGTVSPAVCDVLDMKLDW